MRSNGSNYEDSHPTEARLLLALDDELERHETVAIARRVERCAACQAQWEQLRRISGFPTTADVTSLGLVARPCRGRISASLAWVPSA